MTEEGVIVKENQGSIIAGMFWMLIISLLLFWLPAFGSLIAGIVGGKQAGGIMAGITAALLPGILVGVALFFASTMLTTLPMIGAVFGLGTILLYTIYVAPIVIGAIIGGLLA